MFRHQAERTTIEILKDAKDSLVHRFFTYWKIPKVALPESQSIAAMSSSSSNSDLKWQLLELAVKLALTGIFTYVTLRWALNQIDPTNDQKKKAKRCSAEILKTLGIQGKTLTEYELVIAQQLISPSELGIAWQDIGGCEHLIEELQDVVILPLRLGLQSPLIAPPKGVLLYGPPGCGKTLLAKAIAKAAGAKFINLQVSCLTDKWYGESQKLTDAVFSLATKLQPAIIFIDEIDSFLRTRQSYDHEATAMMKAQFMALWDGFASNHSVRIFVLGATNRPQDVDDAILRRMPARFHVRMPNALQRVMILEVILRGERLGVDVDLNSIAEEAAQCSGSDLREVCRIAAVTRAKDIITQGELLSSAETRPLTQQDLLVGVAKVKANKRLDRSSSGFARDGAALINELNEEDTVGLD